MQNLINTLQPLLVGKTIKYIRYMNDHEMEYFMWNKRPVVIVLDDGTFIVPQRDDEGNDGGALSIISNVTHSIIPTI